MPRYEDDPPEKSRKRSPLKIVRPFEMVEIPGGFEFRDANGVVVANVPTTANPEAFPKALSHEDGLKIAQALLRNLNEGRPKPPSDEPSQDEQHDDRQGYDRGTAQKGRGGTGGARGARSRPSGIKGYTGPVQDGGARYPKRQGASR